MMKARSLGFAMPIVIFILVILAGLSAAVVSIRSNQASSLTYETLGGRARQAARAGVEYGLASISIGHGTSIASECPAASSLSMPTDSLMKGFTVTVSCTLSGDIYTVNAVACNHPMAGACPNTDAFAASSNDYVEARMTANISSGTPFQHVRIVQF